MGRKSIQCIATYFNTIYVDRTRDSHSQKLGVICRMAECQKKPPASSIFSPSSIKIGYSGIHHMPEVFGSDNPALKSIKMSSRL
mmetsp:Transcript_26687/g.57467  ORF Transcript_26687/g.57467 Transcript_26687/m.57467 type:complete len:84 (-) Transcript_26687:439-690(-)